MGLQEDTSSGDAAYGLFLQAHVSVARKGGLLGAPVIRGDGDAVHEAGVAWQQRVLLPCCRAVHLRQDWPCLKPSQLCMDCHCMCPRRCTELRLICGSRPTACFMHASSHYQIPPVDKCCIVPEAGLRAGWRRSTLSAFLPDRIPCMHMSEGWEQRTSTPLLVHCMKSFPSCEKASSLTCIAITHSQTI